MTKNLITNFVDEHHQQFLGALNHLRPETLQQGRYARRQLTYAQITLYVGLKNVQGDIVFCFGQKRV